MSFDADADVNADAHADADDSQTNTVVPGGVICVVCAGCISLGYETN